MNKFNVFNYLNSILYESNFIESSAGTGKTNIISLLFLRFLLNINIDKNFYNLLINNILIVTFTDLATLEIKKRILNNIRNLKLSCINKYCIDNKIKYIFEYIKNISNIINKLIQLEYQIDNFSVFTIHGFCKKIIFSNFLEFNIDTNSKILSDENNFIYELIICYWYKYLSVLSENIIILIVKYWSNYYFLFKDIIIFLNFIKIKFNFNIKIYNNIEFCYYNIINVINNFKKEWLLNNNFLYKYFLYFEDKIFSKKYLNKLFISINLWSKEKTINFNIPKNLYKLSYSYLLKFNSKNFIDKNFIFIYIDYLLLKIKDLYNYILIDCINFIKKNLRKNKLDKSLISFNDLIFKFNYILNNDNKLLFINYIRKNYPIVLIDEFQDTDINQYDIFYKIYINNISLFKTKIILIGDPKQSIYSFRGANIFNYISIKKDIKFFYTLNINWRSSFYLNKSINYLFKKIKNPFIFKNIPYLKLKSYKYNKELYILNKNIIDYSIKIFIFKNLKNLNKKKKLAEYCAIKIIKLLNNNKNFILDKNLNKRNIIFSDICILVYSNSDINIILDIFQEFNLPILSNFNKINIFNTLESKELICILRSILFPISKINLKNTLLTFLFGFNIFNVNEYINNNKNYNNIIEEFYLYYDIWNNYSFYSMIKFILNSKKNILNTLKNKNQYILNFIHLSEILQKKYLKLNDKFLLLKWFEDKLHNLNVLDYKYNIRSSFYNIDSINISTIHKSKGLQYNIVWLPFLIVLKKNNKFYYYHNRKNFILNIDLYKNKFNKKLMLEEIYSEEMRLFYVAITRSIYQCNIFIYNLGNKNIFFDSIYINNILGINKKYNFKKLKYFIKKEFNFKFIYIKIININNFIKKKIFYYFNLLNKIKDKNIYKNFNNILYKNIFNYSNIKKRIYFNKNKIKYLYKNILNKCNNNNIFLPRGKNIGNFFHNLLENLNFKKKINIDFILLKLNEFNISKNLFFIIKNIILNLLNVKLKYININLYNKNISYFFKEFNFFLYISKKLNFINYTNIINKYDLISKNCNNLDLNFKLYGYLNGVIDLIFVVDNKYYIIDYKTNWINNHYTFYNNINMFKIMCKNRYDIQYQLYSLALHKFLKMKLNNYNYNINFGGIYYIFLRGLFLDTNNISITGIYFIKPKFKLINKLSKFFKKKKIFYEK